MDQPSVQVRAVGAGDEAAFTRLARESLAFHESLVVAPKTTDAFARYLQGFESGAKGYVICRDGGTQIVGFVNVNGIVGAPYHRGILGYGIFEPFARRGYMRQALRQIVGLCFTELGLHRIEADIQPSNQASARLVRSLGFRCEGLSEGFVQINGEWRDHHRWALVKGAAAVPPPLPAP